MSGFGNCRQTAQAVDFKSEDAPEGWRSPASPCPDSPRVTGRVLGIYGMARIGPAVAGRARALGMEIHYCKLHRLPPETEKDAVFHADADDLLAVSSFLTLHAPDSALPQFQDHRVAAERRDCRKCCAQ